MDKDFEALLMASGQRVTAPRRNIFTTLKLAVGPLSHAEIAARTPEVDRVTVYRTSELFLRLGIITAVAYGWRQRYELAAPFRPHHHHLFCVKCDNVKEFQSEELEKLLHTAAKRDDFLVLGHTFEVTGICRECRASVIS